MSESVTFPFKKIAVISIILNILFISFIALTIFNPSEQDCHACTLEDCNAFLPQNLAENKISNPAPNTGSGEEANAAEQEPSSIFEQMNDIEKQYFAVAKDFFLKSPTYSFDGLSDVGVDAFIVSENEITFGFTFSCSHPGYGNRFSAPLQDIVSEHKMSVTVKDSALISAVTDEKYDEINKQYFGLPFG